MTRKLKALGMGLVAAMALGAVSASAASAQDTIESGSESGNTYLTGVGTDNVFTVPTTGGGKVEVVCATARFVGSYSGATTSEASVTPTYTGTPEGEHGSEHCDGPGGAATIDMNSCGYNLTGETSGGLAAVHVECAEEGDAIKVTGPACTLSIPAQSPAGGVSYEDDGSSIVVDANVSGIEYTETGFGCTLLGLHSGNAGTYGGSVTTEAFEDAAHENQVSLDVE